MCMLLISAVIDKSRVCPLSMLSTVCWAGVCVSVNVYLSSSLGCLLGCDTIRLFCLSFTAKITKLRVNTLLDYQHHPVQRYC